MKQTKICLERNFYFFARFISLCTFSLWKSKRGKMSEETWFETLTSWQIWHQLMEGSVGHRFVYQVPSVGCKSENMFLLCTICYASKNQSKLMWQEKYFMDLLKKNCILKNSQDMLSVNCELYHLLIGCELALPKTCD